MAFHGVHRGGWNRTANRWLLAGGRIAARPRRTWSHRSYCASASATNGSAKGSAMATLISVLITFVVVILVLYLVNLLPIDGRAKQIVRVIVVIIGILSLLRYLSVF
jgi:hypothetical protein